MRYRVFVIVGLIMVYAMPKMAVAHRWTDEDKAKLKMEIESDKELNKLKNKVQVKECIFNKVTATYSGLNEIKDPAALVPLLKGCLYEFEPDYFCGKGLECSEKIINFAVEVFFGNDGWITVTENIGLCACGDDIKRGIIRDFPHRYVYTPWSKEDRKFKVLAVQRNGKSEPYQLNHVEYGTETRIGSADVEISGFQQYQFKYKTTRQMEFVGDSIVEFYWNVTGNYWNFNILSASIRIPVINGLPVLYTKALTGKEGSVDSTNATVDINSDWIEIRTLSKLKRNEG